MRKSPSPRRRFQFGLRTLMIGVTLLCVVAGVYIGEQRKIVAVRQEWIRDDRDLSISAATPENNDLPWLRRLLGDSKVNEIRVRPSLLIDNDFAIRLREAFPEATIRPWDLQYGIKIN
jgi:hypothetical protein